MLHTICAFIAILLMHRMVFQKSEEEIFKFIRVGEQFIRFFQIWCAVLLLLAIFHPLTSLLVCLSTILVRHISFFILEYHFRESLESFQLQFFELATLEVAAGKAFREVLKNDFSNFHPLFQVQMAQILEMISLKKPVNRSLNPKIRNFIQILIKIDGANHKTLQILKYHRQNFRMRLKIRQKSRAASAPVRAQMLIGGLIYVGILLFYLISDLKLNWWLIFVSLCFIFSAFWSLNSIIRSSKWNT